MKKYLDRISGNSDVILVAALVIILMVLLFPVPTWILDLLLSFSVSVSIVILTVTLLIKHPLDLNSFPSILLITTLMRLSLNIASTRLILANGHKGTFAAGDVIEAFGTFVMQGNVIIGIIVFLILTLVNFIVITKGSGRIAEVAARFNLDSMPGKQMAIDSDLSSGLIGQEEAKIKRKKLEQENTFYGAMDGANKFVRGDAIAGLIITFINLVGGIIVAVVQRGIPFGSAVQTYSVLTIGDGLVSQIPSLIISLSAGLLVTKSGDEDSAQKAIFSQLSANHKPLFMAGIVAGLMGVLPGLPFIPFAFIGGSLCGLGYIVHKNNIEAQRLEHKQKEEGNSKKEQSAKEGAIPKLDYITLELGTGLLRYVDDSSGQLLLNRVKLLRKQIAKDLGFAMSSVRLQDSSDIDKNSYIIKIKEVAVASGSIKPGEFLVINAATGIGGKIDIPGEDTIEPSFGLKAKWIGASYRDDAMAKNYTVVDAPTVIMTHFSEVIKENISLLISYTETQKMVDDIEPSHAKMIKNIFPDLLTISTLQKVLQGLLAELIPIRDFATIIEAAADASTETKNIVQIIEKVRIKLSMAISSLYAENKVIYAITLTQETENELLSYVEQKGEGFSFNIPLKTSQSMRNNIKHFIENNIGKHSNIVVLVTSVLRPHIRDVLKTVKPHINVMSYKEVNPDYQIYSVENL